MINWEMNLPFDDVAFMKFKMLSSGARIEESALQWISGEYKEPIRTRSGASGGLDLVLPYNIHVNCPVNEEYAAESDVIIRITDGQLFAIQEGKQPVPLELQKRPTIYDQQTSAGIPMIRIAQMCSGDRICVGMTGPYCYFWKAEWRCKFCSIGLNAPSDARRKKIADIVEVVGAAANDSNLPARHVLLGGGTLNGEDMGAVLASQICGAIKTKLNLSVYVMIAAPLKNHYIDMLKDSGVDELGMNIEFNSDEAWEKYIPGKNQIIGKRRYLEALEYSVKILGPIKTRSLVIAGLEPIDQTLKGVERLASIGVMPILSPFRPLTGTELANARGFDAHKNLTLYKEAFSIAMNHGIPLGPTCIPCQNNTLALPVGSPHYRFY